MSDVTWQALIAAVVTVVLAYMQKRGQTAAKESADAAAQHADEVKAALKKSTEANTGKLDGIAKEVNSTHVLVNSARGQLLKLYATAARSLADRTQDPKNIQAAVDAEHELAEHVSRQAAMDAQQEKKP
jgi:hypothetical protein